MTKAALIIEIQRVCPEIKIETRYGGGRMYIQSICDPVLGINETYTTMDQPAAREMLNYIYNQVKEEK